MNAALAERERRKRDDAPDARERFNWMNQFYCNCLHSIADCIPLAKQGIWHSIEAAVKAADSTVVYDEIPSLIEQANAERDALHAELAEFTQDWKATIADLNTANEAIARLSRENEALREALEEIEQIPAVTFTRDQQEMANRTIDKMAEIAHAALSTKGDA